MSVSHEKLSSNWKSKQKRNNESSEGRAHPVTCIICGKPRRLHGHCISGTSVYPWDTNTDQRGRGRERERESGYWPNKALDAMEWPQRRSILEGKSTAAYDDDDEVAWVSVPVWDATVWVFVCVCVCVWATNIRFANETIAVFDQFHNWCNPANRYISDQDDQGLGGHCQIEMFWVHSRVNSTHTYIYNLCSPRQCWTTRA